MSVSHIIQKKEMLRYKLIIYVSIYNLFFLNMYVDI